MVEAEKDSSVWILGFLGPFPRRRNTWRGIRASIPRCTFSKAAPYFILKTEQPAIDFTFCRYARKPPSKSPQFVPGPGVGQAGFLHPPTHTTYLGPGYNCKSRGLTSDLLISEKIWSQDPISCILTEKPFTKGTLQGPEVILLCEVWHTGVHRWTDNKEWKGAIFPTGLGHIPSFTSSTKHKLQHIRPQGFGEDKFSMTCKEPWASDGKQWCKLKHITFSDHKIFF